MSKMRYIVLVGIFILTPSILFSAQKPVILDPTYNHDKYKTLPRDHIREFRAYTSSFDSNDDNDGDGKPDTWGIPEWVSYEIRRFEGQCIPTIKRPAWFSDNALVDSGEAPTDDSYEYSTAWRNRHKNWYVRGHLAMKLLAERLGADAAWNTHTLLNAVPQRSEFNGGIWLELEYLTGAWANEYGSVWVITGPIIVDGKPSGYIGQGDEFKVAIPDALFKIVVKDSGDAVKPDVLAFIYPQVGPSYSGKAPFPHQNYLVSVDEIEKMTGLDFFTSLTKKQQENIETKKQTWLWRVSDNNFVVACRRS